MAGTGWVMRLKKEDGFKTVLFVIQTKVAHDILFNIAIIINILKRKAL